MDKDNKEYIVTKIEKYSEIIDNEYSVKLVIDVICYLTFAILRRMTLTPLLEDADMVVNQILGDVSLLGLAVTTYNLLTKVVKLIYGGIMLCIFNNKLQKYDEESQMGISTTENNGGKNR